MQRTLVVLLVLFLAQVSVGAQQKFDSAWRFQDVFMTSPPIPANKDVTVSALGFGVIYMPLRLGRLSLGGGLALGRFPITDWDRQSPYRHTLYTLVPNAAISYRIWGPLEANAAYGRVQFPKSASTRVDDY